jgi:hypothetical protein
MHPDPSSRWVTPAPSAAAPGSAQDARTRPVTNHTAPVDAGSCAAVERVGGRPSERWIRPRGTSRRTRVPHFHDHTGGPVSDAGIAGMAGPAGAGRPEFSGPRRTRKTP